MAAALAVTDTGLEALVLERDSIPAGNTSLSSGMIPACGTAQQRQADVDDSVDIMSADILKKARNQADPDLVQTICEASGPLIDWLVEKHGVELTLVEGFVYPGHSRIRMHAPASRSGLELINSLSSAADNAGVTVMTDSLVEQLFVDTNGKLTGLQVRHPDDSLELIGCETLILACNGFGGNAELVENYMPSMSNATYFGHPGNQGDALLWGQELGAETGDLGSFQGHGSVAEPHGILISWALMMEGGIQVNKNGERFSNEHAGYSEQARLVLKQPDGIAWNIYDNRLHQIATDLEDYRKAESMGAVKIADDVESLAEITSTPLEALKKTLTRVQDLVNGSGSDAFGRDFSSNPMLEPPYYATRVTGALFHTQGGLVVDSTARVKRQVGGSFENLFAGGGAAAGISGPEDWGYLSGNGLLTALTLGRIAGDNAAAMVKQQ